MLHRYRLLPLLLLSGLLTLSGVSASAQVLFQPAAVSTNLGTFSGSNINNTIDQSALSTTYSSGITPLAGYNATHRNILASDYWASASGTTTGNVIFDLGVARTIGTLVLWNGTPGNGTGINTFALSAANVADFSSGVTTLGNFTTNTTGTAFAINLETFSFSATTARYFRMNITANAGSTDFTIFGEAAFASATVSATAPEPGTFALLALGAVACGTIIRRRKA